MTIKEAILARLALAERDEESIPLGCTLRLRELTRAQWRDAIAFASSDDMAERERARGALLASADLEDADARRAALTRFWLGAPEQGLNRDRWHAAIVAAGVVDQETGEPLFTRDEILAWPHRDEIWSELDRLTQIVLAVSEVGEAHLKKESSPSSPATD